MNLKIDDAMAKILRSVSKTELTALELEKAHGKAISLGDAFRDRSLGIQAKELIDMVEVIRKGWSLDEIPIIRAKVK